jgi:hypothetical protein
LAGAAAFAGAACGRRAADHRFPEASALREKAEANGAKAGQLLHDFFLNLEYWTKKIF